MRINRLALLMIAISVSTSIQAQKIMMKVSYLKPVAYGTAEEIRALEYKIEAVTNYTSGPGASVGKPIPGELVIKKNADSTSVGLFRKITMGSSLPFVKIDYFDKNDLNYFTITLTDAFVTQFYFLSPECPSCIKLEHQVGLVFKTMKLEDKINNTTVTWDISMMTVN